MDDVRLDVAGEAGQRRHHAIAAQHRHAQERVELLEPVHLDPLQLAARVDAPRGDVHLVAALGEPSRPAREVARLRVADPEDAQLVVSHRSRA